VQWPTPNKRTPPENWQAIRSGNTVVGAENTLGRTAGAGSSLSSGSGVAHALAASTSNIGITRIVAALHALLVLTHSSECCPIHERCAPNGGVNFVWYWRDSWPGASSAQTLLNVYGNIPSGLRGGKIRQEAPIIRK